MMKPVLALVTVSLLLIASVSSSAFAEAKKKTSAEKRPPSAAQIALRDRQKKCGVEWREAKAAGKVETGMKWPQYWSACNKRLKGT
jgi:hypothetical protein